jgi:hypothetical protein
MDKDLLLETISWIATQPECVDIGTSVRPYIDCLDEYIPDLPIRRNALVTVILHLTETPVIGRDGNHAYSLGYTENGYAFTEAMYALGLNKEEMDILDHRYKGAWPRVYESALAALVDTHTCQITDPIKYGEVVVSYLKWFAKNYPNVAP